MLLPDPAPDGEVYVTMAQAAEAMGVKPAAVRRWVRIGHLPEAAAGVYALSAVAAAEKAARDAAARTRFRPELRAPRRPHTCAASPSIQRAYRGSLPPERTNS